MSRSQGSLLGHLPYVRCHSCLRVPARSQHDPLFLLLMLGAGTSLRNKPRGGGNRLVSCPFSAGNGRIFDLGAKWPEDSFPF